MKKGLLPGPRASKDCVKSKNNAASDEKILSACVYVVDGYCFISYSVVDCGVYQCSAVAKPRGGNGKILKLYFTEWCI